METEFGVQVIADYEKSNSHETYTYESRIQLSYFQSFLMKGLFKNAGMFLN